MSESDILDHLSAETLRALVKKSLAEADALRAEVEKWKQLDREAATHVESVICMKSNRFTGDPPYVGWKGLGLALREDYDELSALRARVEKLEGVVNEALIKVENDRTMWTEEWLVWKQDARAALGDTHE